MPRAPSIRSFRPAIVAAVSLALGLAAATLTGCGGCKNEHAGGPDGALVDALGCGGDTPCAADQACRYDTCVPTPVPCGALGECPGDAHCDTSTNECLPWAVGPNGDHDDACIRDVVPGVFFPGVQCEWLGPPAGDPFPDHKNVLGTPMVATFGGTGGGEFGSPSIVFISYNFTDGGGESCQGTNPLYFGVLRVIDGRTCEQQASLPDPLIASQSVAIGDLGGDDATPEVVAARQDGGLIAFTRRNDGTWEVLWRSADHFDDTACNWSGLSIHDLDDDGVPEILLEGAVYSAAGLLLNTPIPRASLDPVSNGYIPVVGDVDGDGAPELVTGGRVYGWDTATTEWVAEGPALGTNGRIAIADLGTYGAAGADDRGALDGIPEIASVSGGVLRVYALGGRLVFTANLQGTAPGNGGPPTIADFDGDGRAELASAGGTAYTVFDPDCVAGATADVCPSGRADGVLWFQRSQDGSSNVTGSSVFDFEGDGRAEAVYADECFTRVYDGTTGDVEYSRFRRSCTWFENPVVADVDADFNAEIVVNSNVNCANIVCPTLDPIFDGIRCLDDSDCTGATTCGREQAGDPLGRCRCAADADCGGDGFVCRDPIAGPSAAGQVCRASNPGVGTAFGVRVLADRVDRWVNTRPIWNQHAYSVTNVNDDGTVPRTSMWLRNWTQPGLNNFRQNAPGTGLGAGASPDQTVRRATVSCIPGGARVAMEVCNRGTEPVARGLKVSVYGGNPPSVPGCTASTRFNLAVGACETVSCDWPAAGAVGTVIVDDDGSGTAGAAGQSENLECREDNNRFVLNNLNCGL
jgi:hypothetical protein